MVAVPSSSPPRYTLLDEVLRQIQVRLEATDTPPVLQIVNRQSEANRAKIRYADAAVLTFRKK